MYSTEPMSADNTSNTGHDANINTLNHIRLIDDETQVTGELGENQDGDTTPGVFPQFVQLPPELRHQIWQFYCPDLSVKARVLPILGWPCPIRPGMNDYSLLADHTKNLRKMLSTHRESRRIAMLKYPDELVMDAAPGTSIVRFRKETDVIFLKELVTNVKYFLPDFGKKIENLAVEIVVNGREQYEGEDLLLKALPALKRWFPNLRRLFSYGPTSSSLPSRGDWCTFEYVHWYTAEVRRYYERGPGPVEYTNTLYCWPDLDTYPDLVRSLAPKICSLQAMDKAGVEFWPLVRFRTNISMEAYDMMRRKCWPSSEKVDDSSEANQAIDNGSEANQAIENGGEANQAIDNGSDEIDHDSDLSGLHKRKGIIVGPDVEEEAEIGHDDDGGRPKKKRARLSRQKLGSDEKEEGGAEDL